MPAPESARACAAATDEALETFAERLLSWFDVHGRHDLPWQHPREPYRVWLAEIMLQQTQVATVLPYYLRFVERFPDVLTLASAPVDDVLALWSGLGYYARARNLHRCAQQIVAQFDGRLPEDFATLSSLPGIGRSTAGAILAQAHGRRLPILDGNVRRVLARHAGIEGWPGTLAIQDKLWTLAESRLPQTRLCDYTQALMDLGATVCTRARPRCEQCPLRADCVALDNDAVGRLPTPRPARAREHRVARLLLATDAQQRILLGRRASFGVWGGLWCPPLLDDERLGEDANAWLLAALEDALVEELPPLRHVFTHFELAILPVRITGLRVPLMVGEEIGEGGQWQWVKLADLDALGLPAPVRALIQRHVIHH